MPTPRSIRIAYTGGGSGGHIYPLLAVADQISALAPTLHTQVSYYYFGKPGQYSQEFIKRNILIKRVMSVKLRRYFSISNIVDVIKFPFACIQAFVSMLLLMPDILFSKGGTGALPVVFAAWILRIPIFIHESDSIPGLTNSISYRLASRAGVAFAETLDYFTGNKAAVVGNPLRAFLLEPSDITQEQAKKIWGFDPHIPLILVWGGSQGAQFINEFMLDNIEPLVTSYQVLHQTGISNFNTFKEELAIASENLIEPQKKRYKIIDFFQENIKDALIAADIVVSRAGSGSLFEIAHFHKQAIIIPLRESGNNHQAYNAYAYQKEEGGVVIEEENLKPSLFFMELEKLLRQPQPPHEDGKGNFSQATAARVIAQEIIRMIS